MFKNKKIVLAAASVFALAVVFGMAACSQQSTSKATPAADEYGVVTAESWAAAWPDEYETYLQNSENSPDSGKHDYLELYPALNTMYKGYAFSLDYDEAASHLYTLDSVKNTLRTIEKEQLANCITCKTPQFTAQVNAEGDGVYAEKFNDMIGNYTEPISCYNCHENNVQTLKPMNQFWYDSMGADAGSIPAQSKVCGQCHNEYYFNPDTKVTTNPYSGLAAMSPDAILAYYDDMGFKDWVHPVSGAAMIKVQHPEFETVYGKSESGQSIMAATNGYTCADCHMPEVRTETGKTYTSHYWQSPLENETLVTENCNVSGCHSDVVKQVTGWQDESEARVVAISEKIEDLINGIGEQVTVTDGESALNPDATITEEQLAELQKLHREAQFYWDFVMVENSEGVHNRALANDTLDKAEAAADAGLAILAA